jgi:cysteinyl-tRNA synthetase
MSTLRLYNTLTHRKEPFEPADGKTARIYCCGPTVYNFAHIGNLRTYIFEDLLRRVILRCGWNVRHVMNITDVGHMTSDGDAGEDKMMKASIREQRSPWEIARFYEEAFFRDCGRLNIQRPDLTPRATEHVDEMIHMIQKLDENGFVYRTQEGLYFDTARFADYGKLADLDISGQMLGARAEVNVDPDKRRPSDFMLWFTNKPSHVMKWDSPWGIGYPGWHIECSAMSINALGETLDIHCGGIDHVPVHNTNEIAQSEAATGQQFARFWVHGAFLNIKGSGGTGHAKMAKSGDNFLTVDRLIEAGYDPIIYRYLCLTAHYRSELMFSWDALAGAKKALGRVYEIRGRLGERAADDPLTEKEYDAAKLAVEAALLDDLNAPKAIGILHEAGSFRLWREFDNVLGLHVHERSRRARGAEPIPEEITALLTRRSAARKRRDWTESDRIRAEIENAGFTVSDDRGESSAKWNLV